MKKLLLLFIFLTSVAIKGYSQTGRQVTGIVADSAGVTVPGTVVKLTSATDSLNVVTNMDGVFVFPSVKAKQFSLTILSIGFQGLKRSYTFDADNKPANMGMIKLKTESKMLGTVQITDVNAIKIKEDTTEYKASAYPVRANAPVEDMIKKLPGVDVDANGTVTSMGKQVTKVRINGKDFFGGDVQTATKNLPADVIESVQMIQDYGDQANLTGIKTGEPNTIMNIVIRSDKNYGYSLSGTAGDGADALPSPATNSNRYIGSINSFKFKGDQQIALLGSINNTNVNTFSFGGGGGGGGFTGGGGRGNAGRGAIAATSPNGITLARSIGLNFRDQWGKKLSVYGSYSFADNSTNTVSQTIQTTNPLTANPLINNQASNQTNGILNHRFTWNMEWKPDTINYFKFTPTYAYSSTTTSELDSNSFRGNNISPYANTTKSYSTSTSPSYGATLLYNHRFNGHGRNLSIDASATTAPSTQYQNPIVTYTLGKPTIIVPGNQVININGRTTTTTASISYIEPLSKVSYLEATYAYSNTKTDNNKIADTVNTAGQNVFYDRLSNTYNSTFTTNRFGLNYRLIEAKYNLTLGGVIQPSQLVGYSPATARFSAVNTTVNTTNIAPNAHFVYNFSRSQSLNINYSGTSSQPTYAQLNPRPDSSNASYIVTGNPALKPEFNNSLNIRYNKFSFGTGDLFIAALNFSQINNRIVTNTQIQSGSNVQTINYLNTDGYYTGTAFLTYAKPWDKRKYTLVVNGAVSYTNNVGYGNGVKTTAETFTYTPGLRFRVDLTDILDIEARGSYAVNDVTNQANSNFQTTTLALNGKNYLWKNWTVSYDYNKIIYQGYSGSTSNPNVLNAYVERRFLNNNAATIRLAAYDLFNQNTGVTNAITSNSITQSLVNKLGRYYLVTLTIRLQKFAGKAPSQDMGPDGRRRGDGGGMGGGRPGGGGGMGGGGFGGGPQ